MTKKIYFSVLLSAIALPGLAFAQTIQSMTDAAVSTGLYVAGGIVVILWVVTGVIFLSAAGQPEKVSAGKKALMAAVAGTVIVIVAASAASLVGSAFGI